MSNSTFVGRKKSILNIGKHFCSKVYNGEGKQWKRQKQIDYNYFRTTIMFNMLNAHICELVKFIVTLVIKMNC